MPGLYMYLQALQKGLVFFGRDTYGNSDEFIAAVASDEDMGQSGFFQCFQAGIIVVALALAGLFFGVAGTLISTTFGDTSILQGDLATGFAAAFVSILPALVALGTVTGIVKKSEGVANALFGLQ